MVVYCAAHSPDYKMEEDPMKILFTEKQASKVLESNLRPRKTISTLEHPKRIKAMKEIPFSKVDPFFLIRDLRNQAIQKSEAKILNF